nr:hypothetical protein [Tanacetum cinerariifolium]
VPAPVVGNHAVAFLQEKHHLGVPVVARQRPPVVEEKWLARTPVFVVDFGAIPDSANLPTCFASLTVKSPAFATGGGLPAAARSYVLCASRSHLLPGQGRSGQVAAVVGGRGVVVLFEQLVEVAHVGEGQLIGDLRNGERAQQQPGFHQFELVAQDVLAQRLAGFLLEKRAQ